MHTQVGAVLGDRSRTCRLSKRRGDDVDARTSTYGLWASCFMKCSLGVNRFLVKSRRNLSGHSEERPASSDTRHGTDSAFGLQRIMTKALQKTREDRYQTATDFMHDLQDVAGSSPGESLRPPAVPADHQAVEVFGVRTASPGDAIFVDDTLDVEDEAYQHELPLAGTTNQQNPRQGTLGPTPFYLMESYCRGVPGWPSMRLLW